MYPMSHRRKHKETTSEQRDRVLMFHSYNKINERMRHIISSLLGEGYSVKVLMWDRFNVNEPHMDEHSISEIDTHIIKFRVASNLLFQLFGIMVLYVKAGALLLRESYSVLHCCHPSLLLLSIVISRIKRVRLIYDVFELHQISISERLAARLGFVDWVSLYNWCEGQMIKCTHGVLTIDTKDDFLLRHSSYFQSNTTALLNVPSIMECPSFQDWTRFQDRRNTIIMIGGLTADKGLFKAIEAIRQVRRSVSNVKLVLIGSFRDGREDLFFSYVNYYKLQDNVIYYPWMPYAELLQYVASAEMGLALYQPRPRYQLSRGNCRRIFTYWSCSIPVITPINTGIGDLTRDIQGGMVVDTTDSSEIARSIEKLLDNRDITRQLGTNGRIAIEEGLNWEAETMKLIHIYDNAQ